MLDYFFLFSLLGSISNAILDDNSSNVLNVCGNITITCYFVTQMWFYLYTFFVLGLEDQYVGSNHN